MRLRAILASLALALTSLGAQAETIRVAIGTQDTTQTSINPHEKKK